VTSVLRLSSRLRNYRAEGGRMKDPHDNPDRRAGRVAVCPAIDIEQHILSVCQALITRRGWCVP